MMSATIPKAVLIGRAIAALPALAKRCEPAPGVEKIERVGRQLQQPRHAHWCVARCPQQAFVELRGEFSRCLGDVRLFLFGVGQRFGEPAQLRGELRHDFHSRAEEFAQARAHSVAVFHPECLARASWLGRRRRRHRSARSGVRAQRSNPCVRPPIPFAATASCRLSSETDFNLRCSARRIKPTASLTPPMRMRSLVFSSACSVSCRVLSSSCFCTRSSDKRVMVCAS